MCTGHAGVVHAWVGQIVPFFAYSPPSRPLDSPTPIQPGRVTHPTRGYPGALSEAPQAVCIAMVSKVTLCRPRPALRRRPRHPIHHRGASRRQDLWRGPVHGGGDEQNLFLCLPEGAPRQHGRSASKHAEGAVLAAPAHIYPPGRLLSRQAWPRVLPIYLYLLYLYLSVYLAPGREAQNARKAPHVVPSPVRNPVAFTSQVGQLVAGTGGSTGTPMLVAASSCLLAVDWQGTKQPYQLELTPGMDAIRAR